MNFLGNLHGQFARRAKNQNLHGALICIHLFNGGDSERGGLAGAGLRLADDVLPAISTGMAAAWMGAACSKPKFINGLEHLFGQAQFGKQFWCHDSLVIYQYNRVR